MNRIIGARAASSAGADLQSVPGLRTDHKSARAGKLNNLLLLCGMILILASCDREDHNGNNENNSNIYLGAVNITVNTLAFGEGGDINLQSGSPSQEEGGLRSMTGKSIEKNKQAVRIADDLLMYAALQEDETPVTLRNIALTPGTRVRIVAYAGTGYTTYVDHAEYEETVMGTLAAVGADLLIPTGPCKFVAYSYNSTAPMPPHIPAMTVNVSNDLLWGETTTTVTGSTFNLYITMQHLFSQVKMDASLASGAPIFLSNFNIGQAELLSYQQPELTVQSGALTPGATSSATFTNPGPYTFSNWISATRLVFTNSETPTSLKLTNLTINGNNYSGPFYVNYADPLVSGKSYTLKVVFHKATGGSADRITLEGSGGNAKLVITRDPNDPGLFFKFGGVVGMNHLPGSFDVSTMIVYYPLASPGAITGYGNTTPYLPGIPAFSMENWVAGINNISSDTYHNINNVRAGRGDPCRLIGMTLSEISGFISSVPLYDREQTLAVEIGPDGFPIGGWRMPTYTENERFAGINSTSYSNHWWNASSAPQSPFGTPRVAGGEFPTRNSNGGAPDLSKFLPAVSYRDNATGMYNASALVGAYWSSIPVLYSYNATDYATGYSMIFTATSVLSAMNTMTPPLQAMPVRCVRQDLYWSMLSVSQNEWIPDTLGGGTSGTGDIILLW